MSAHDCPVRDTITRGDGTAVRPCTVKVPRSHLMCKRHWRMVPKPLQTALYAAYRRRDEPGGFLRHVQAMEDCVAAVEGRASTDVST